jgi:hypothetical protein
MLASPQCLKLILRREFISDDPLYLMTCEIIFFCSHYPVISVAFLQPKNICSASIMWESIGCAIYVIYFMSRSVA